MHKKKKKKKKPALRQSKSDKVLYDTSSEIPI